MNKQTNKKTFLDTKYLSQSKSDIQEIIRVTSCGCPNMIKTKEIDKHINKQTTNKSINKQTDKQTNKPF